MMACRTAPILNPSVTLPEAKTEAETAHAIKLAGARLGWEMVDDGPGLMTGTLHLRKHVAVVEIHYDADSYQIQYKDSEALMHQGDKIHRNYNRWVNNLSEEIKSALGYGG
ncbi:MAG: hypothetical protein OZ948_04675 [Deltaproteobacteria bacterium]|nr:hypothetical protein [Deltaproteobacteria bacterium]